MEQWWSRRFASFWLARLAGISGNQMVMVALGWQMYDLTTNAWDLGLVGLLQFAPALLFTLPAGQVVDHFDRRAVLALSFFLQFLAASVLCFASWQHLVSPHLIFGASIAYGVARAFQMPAQQAMLPLLVPPSTLPRALAASAAAMQTAIIAGPVVGGFVYALGPTHVYGLAFCLLLVATASVVSIGPLSGQARGAHAGWPDLFAGLRFVRGQSVMLGAMSLDLFAVLLGGATALLPMFAKDILHTGPWGVGLLRAAPALGALLVSAWLARRPIERKVGRTLFVAVAVYGVATLVFAFSRYFALSFLALLTCGGSDMISIVIRQTLVQLETPDEMRGRVSAVNSVFIGASNQLGEFESGATAAWLGPVGSVVLGGLGTLVVVGLWRRWFPALAQRDSLRAPHGEGSEGPLSRTPSRKSKPAGS